MYLPNRIAATAIPIGLLGAARQLSLATLATLSMTLGCERLARGPGAPGAAPIERTTEGTASPASAPFALPDPCRGTPLPDDQHFVAKGLCARVVASKQGELRQITFAPNGDLFGVTIPGAIRRYRDVNHDGVFEPNEVVEWANTGNENGNNCAIDGRAGYLYAGTKDGVNVGNTRPSWNTPGPAKTS